MTFAFEQRLLSSGIYYYPVNKQAEALVDYRLAGFKTLTEKHMRVLNQHGIFPLVINEPMGFPVTKEQDKYSACPEVSFNTKELDIDLIMYKFNDEKPEYIT